MRISDWSSDVCSSDLPTSSASRNAGWAMGRAGPCASRHRTGDHAALPRGSHRLGREIGRASCRERVCQYVYISVVAVSLKKKHGTHHNQPVLMNKHVNINDYV